MKPFWLWGANVIAIVPAYQESQFIANIVKQLKPHKKSGLIKEIIVVDDGSTDNTGKIAKEAGADKVITLPKNRGKLGAFAAAVKDVAARYTPKTGFKSEKARLKKMEQTIVLSLDADLVQITKTQVEKLVRPIVKSRNVDMTVGNTGGLTELSGQRAIRLRALGGLLRQTIMWKTLQETGFFQEIALNRLIKRVKDVKTDFKHGRGYQAELDKEQGIKLSAEWNAGQKYLDWRKETSIRLRKEREMLSLQKLGKREKHKRTRDVLERHRQYERHVAENALSQMRRKLKRRK